ncbi:MAG: class I SAM-dependent methyltransferase [Pelagibacteraceae bacterium]
MKQLKNWDSNTWLSTSQYINKFINFLSKVSPLSKNTAILDIGCGRGTIIAKLADRFAFIQKPIGIDIVKHKPQGKKIKLIKANALKYLRSSKQNFDLILIKQSIHFFNLKEVRQLILYAKKILNKNGRIVIFSLNTKVNEWPKFKSFRDKLKKSLKKDEKIIKLLKTIFKKFRISQFIYKVHLDKRYYLKMLKNRFTSCLLNFSNKELSEGVEEVDHNFKSKINFKDRLICLTYKNK